MPCVSVPVPVSLALAAPRGLLARRDGQTSHWTESMGTFFLQPEGFQASLECKNSPLVCVCRARRVRGKSRSWLRMGGCGSEPLCPQGRAGLCPEGVASHCIPHLSPSGQGKLYPAPAWQLSASLLLPRQVFWDGGFRAKLCSCGSLPPPGSREAWQLCGSHSPCSIPQAGSTSPVLPPGPPPALNPADTPRAPCFRRGFACKMRQLLRAQCGFPQQLLRFFFLLLLVGLVFFFAEHRLT